MKRQMGLKIKRAMIDKYYSFVDFVLSINNFSTSRAIMNYIGTCAIFQALLCKLQALFPSPEIYKFFIHSKYVLKFRNIPEKEVFCQFSAVFCRNRISETFTFAGLQFQLFDIKGIGAAEHWAHWIGPASVCILFQERCSLHFSSA